MSRKRQCSRIWAAWMLALVLIFSFFISGCSDSDEADLDNKTTSIAGSISIEESDKPLPSELASDLTIPSDAVVVSGDSSTPDTTNSASDEVHSESTENSTFEVHYIDVGQADAALVLCDGEAMLIDGGNAADSNLIFAYLDKL